MLHALKSTTKLLCQFLILFVLVSFVLTACGPTGKSGNTGDTGNNGNSPVTSTVLTKSTSIEVGSQKCPNGGKKVEMGVDDNDDGILDSDEVDDTDYFCNGSKDETGGGDNVSYSIGGTVSGLAGGTLALKLNDDEQLDVMADGKLIFLTLLNNALNYDVTVATQPASQTCTVVNGKGVISGANVIDILVSCSVDTYTIGGNIIGLDEYKSITLQNNGGDDLEVTAEGSFTFLTPLAYGLTYSVTVLTYPVSQVCSVKNSTGTIVAANITDVTVKCATNIIPSTVIRTPYLQNVTKNSVDVMWGTDESITSGTLYWGDSPGNYTNSVSSTYFYATEDNADCGGNEISSYSNVVHKATISGLTAGQTVYYYISSEDGTVGFNDPSYKATASPPDNASFRFIAYGDSRPTCANPYPSDNARTRLISTMISHSPDLILHTGDIAINGRLKQFDNFYFAPTVPIAKSTPVFTTIGNHDIRWNGTVPAYRDVYSLPTNSADGTEDYYSFDYGSVHFVSLNTGLLPGGYRNGYKNSERAAEMKDWLENDLNSTTKPWKVIFFHRQYYLKDVDAAWRTIFEENSVSLVLVGHAHHFDSHSRNGVTYIVTGGGGSPLTGSGMAWPSYRIDTFSAYNFVQIDVTQNKLDINVFDIDNILRKNILLNK